MNVRNKIRICIITNLILLILVSTTLYLCSDGKNPYWSYGPNNELIIISVKIDTWFKYGTLIFFLFIINISKVVIEEIGMPILGFNVYNPDKKIITDFKKIELNLYANTMYIISSLRSVLMTVVSISQIDIAIIGVLISEITSIFTVYHLLSEKRFPLDGDAVPVENSEVSLESIVIE